MDAQDVTRKHPIVAAFARRPVTLTVLVLATLLTGAIAQSRIRLEMMPTGLDVRGLSVTIPLRAQRTVLSPQEIEKRITLIAEGELSTIPGIESLISVSTRSEARFEIAFRGDSDLGIAYDQVRDRIERARTKIGADIGAVRYRQWTYGSESIANVSISWDEQVENPFDKLAQQIVPALEAAGGISHVTMNGDLQPYYRIALKRDAIATHPQIHLNRLLDALQADNTTTAVGKIHSGEQDTSIIADARFRSLDDIRAFPVTDNISLGDIADVSEAYNVGGYAYTYQRGTGESVYDGGRSVWTQVYKTSSANIVEAGQAFETKLEELRADPSLAGFTYRVGRNDGTEVVTQLNTLFTSLLLGGVLAVLCLLAFIKSIRLALVIALAIPLSMTMALVVMYFAGETINLLTLMGFTVAGGMLLDNAIVVSENIFRRIPADREPYIASVRGAGEVGMALALATSTTVAVLLSFVVFSKSPEMSFFMTRLAWPIWLSLGFSVIVALLVVPHATSRLFAKGHESASRQRYERLSHRLLSASGTKRFAGTLLSVFFGRPEGMASRDGMGDAVDRFLARRGASQLCWLTLAAIGIGAGVWAFVAAGGDHESISEVWKRIVKGFGGSAGRGDWRRGRGGDDDEGDPFPALIALGVFAGILLIPPLVVRLLPRRDDQSSATPLLSRLQRIYGAMIARACVHPMRAAMIVALAMAALVFTGVSLIKTTESNPGNQKSLSFRVHFPTPIDLKLDPQGTGFEGKTGMPREWAYFLDLRRIFLGIDPDGSTDQRAQQAAWERFGIERGTLNLSSSSIRLWLTLDSSRIDEAKELEDAIREAFPETPGLRLSGGASGRSTIRVQLRGKEFSRLKELSGEVIRALSRLRGLESVEEDMESSPFQELVLAVDEKRAAAMGVRPADLARVVSFQINGTRIEDYIAPGITRPIQVVLDDPQSRSGETRRAIIEDAQQVMVPAAGETQVPVSAVTIPDPVERGGVGEIRRLDRQTTLTVNAQTDDPIFEVTERVRDTLAGLELPAGYAVEVASSGFSGGGGRSRMRLGNESPLSVTAAAATVLVLAFVMGFLFESFVLPLVVILACVPGAIAGTLWSLLLTDTLLDQMCYLGLIILIGVSVNNGIVLVDLVNRLRSEGKPMAEALKEAGEQRIRPILMTSLTTALGIVPMAIGSAEFVGRPYYPLGRAILGGMILSTLLTLIALPLFYVLAERAREFCRALFFPAGTGSKVEGASWDAQP